MKYALTAGVICGALLMLIGMLQNDIASAVSGAAFYLGNTYLASKN